MIDISEVRLIVVLLFFMIVPAGLSYFIAKDKGKNVGLWTILGLIPYLNIGILLFLVSATNQRTEAKLDKIVAYIDSQK